jgi:sec-independent protein translocase protein TatC
VSAVFKRKIEAGDAEGEVGGQMSFLEHLDEVRKRLMWSAAFVGVAFVFCFFVSNHIFNFLARPTQEALGEAQQREIKIEGGLTGQERILPLSQLKEGDGGRYVFDNSTKLGEVVVPPGTTVMTRVLPDANGNLGLFTDEQLFAGNAVIPQGVRVPLDFTAQPSGGYSADERLIVTTAVESFTLYMTVSLYAAIALSVPFLLWQIWGFISPGLYPHERRYATPFIGLSTISFVLGAAFAYYIIFPPAVRYLLGVGQDFRLMLRATDYFDFITLIMLAMGVVFQMPAITYVLARIGLVTPHLLISSWRIALVVILIVAALVSPTPDVTNMMLFAAPMVALYVISIFIAWLFGKKRTAHAEA